MLQKTATMISGRLGRESWIIDCLRSSYESMLNLTYQRRGMPWMLNGVEYRIDPRQRRRLGRDYDGSVAEFLRKRIQSGWTCFDVGANVGAYVLQLAFWSRPSGRVVALEPNTAAVEILERHLKFNDISDRVRIVPVAVSSKSGSSTLYAADADGMSRLSAPNAAIAPRVHPLEVPVITVDEYILQSGMTPDVLIIDVEGFEIEVLAGAKGLIKNKRDLLIVAEMHPNVWSSANTTLGSALELFEGLQLTPVPLQGQSDVMNNHGIVHLRQREHE